MRSKFFKPWPVLALLAISSCLPSFVFASELIISSVHETVEMHLENGAVANLGLPVSIVRVDSDHLAIASYLNVWLLDENTGGVSELKKPEGVSEWYPTGLAYDKKNRELFIANYLGKNVLILKRVGERFVLSREIRDPDLIGAENVALSRDGKYFAVADFDNNGVLLFDRKTKKKIWFEPLGRAHGVSFDSSGKKIIATGLNPPQAAMFNLAGQPLNFRGKEGWGKDGYLWPTGVSNDPRTGKIWVADAHLGKIRELKEDLSEGAAIGGNGLGEGLFNMPYGIFYDSDGRIWVADTFKSRILLLDQKKQNLKSFVSMPELSAGVCSLGDCTSKDEWFSKSGSPVFGDGYVKRVGEANSLSYDFGVHVSQDWHLGFNYSAFSNKDSGQLAMAGAAPFFSSSIYYWIQAEKSGGRLVFGSPQVREWMVDFNGVVCPVSLGLNYWVGDGVLGSDQLPDISLDKVVSICSERIQKFSTGVASGQEPFSAYTQFVLNKDAGHIIPSLNSVFQSTGGLAYFRELCRAESSATRKSISQKYIDTLSADNFTFLPELWIAKIFTSFEGSQDSQGRLGCVGVDN